MLGKGALFLLSVWLVFVVQILRPSPLLIFFLTLASLLRSSHDRSAIIQRSFNARSTLVQSSNDRATIAHRSFNDRPTIVQRMALLPLLVLLSQFRMGALLTLPLAHARNHR